MRRDVTFLSQGLTCAGWLYVPDDPPPGERRPAIVMAHGFTGVKEMDLARFAEHFVAAGFVTLVFDYRYFGASEGEPRCQLFPHAQIEDYRNALTWLSLQPEVDATRIGVWGTSYSGGHVLHLAAFDQRVKAVVSQVPMVDGWQTAQRVLGTEGFVRLRAMLTQDRIRRYTEGTPGYIPVVAKDGEVAAIPNSGTRETLLASQAEAPNWRNEITLESLEHLLEYAPVTTIQHISPTPLLMIVANHDTLTPPDLALEAFEYALHPKSLIFLTIEMHHGIYEEPGFSQALVPTLAWFEQHL